MEYELKARLLDRLRREKGVLSGERMSRELGLSRVGVWKQIHTLRDMGYPIEASHNGYTLSGEPDFLYPWEFPGREALIHYRGEVDSTMGEAHLLAEGGCPEGTVVAADAQLKGRGRGKRVWTSEKGGLYFTVVLREELPLAGF